MSGAIAAVLRDAAMMRHVPALISESVPWSNVGDAAFAYAHSRLDMYFGDMDNEERSAFLYLCSLMAEYEE